jgi:hypothetical protein
MLQQSGMSDEYAASLLRYDELEIKSNMALYKQHYGFDLAYEV